MRRNDAEQIGSPWQFLEIRTQTLLQVGLGPGLDGHAMAELRSPLSSPSPPALNLSQHQGLFQ